MLNRHPLEQLSIPKPCNADWHKMAGQDRDRFGTSCNRPVHDLSKLTRRQVADLLQQSSNRLCARISYDYDGKILLAPESKKRRIEQFFQVSALGISALGCQAAALSPTSDAKQMDMMGVCGITVRVFDLTSAPIPGAQVLVEQEHGPQESKGITDGGGLFTAAVREGRYTLLVESPGFQQYVRHDVEFACDKSSVSVDVQMQVGALMGEVVVLNTHPNPLRKAWFGLNFFLRRTLPLT